MKTILTPIDFSPVSRCVIAEATALARALHGRVVLFHVVQPPVIVSEYGVADAAGMTAALEKAAARHLSRLRKSLQLRFRATAAALARGGPAGEILAHAKKTSADYIVLGSHGHTAFYDLLMGSTASGVLKRARCPVLVVPPPKAKPAKAKK
jgi:nucleotide-binding universal stress UspA family protein